jgi:Flp pilus assembly protein TadB
MDTWLIIVIVVAAIVVLALALWAATRGRERRLESRRVEAGEQREQAELAAQQAEERELAAREELDRAERERAVARGHSARADELDPDVDVESDR